MSKQLFKGWHHYGVMCRDMEESIAFYRDALGFEFMFYAGEMEGADHIKIAFMKNDKLVLELLEPVSWNQEACDWASQGMNHIAFAVGDCDAMQEKLEKEFNVVFTDPEDGPDCKAVFFRGPGGERLELIEMKSDLFPIVHTPNDSPYIRGLAHVGIFSGDIDVSIAFYKDVLGFEHVKTFEEGGPDMGFWNKIALMRLDDTLVEVVCPLAHPQVKEMFKYQARVQMTHLGMDAAIDMQEVIDTIREQADLEWENTTPGISPDIPEGNDMQWALFRDPNGYRWEISHDLGKDY